MQLIWALDRIKISIFTLGRRLHKNVLWIFRRKSKKHNWFWIEKDVVAYKRRLKSHQDPTDCYTIYKMFAKAKVKITKNL